MASSIFHRGYKLGLDTLAVYPCRYTVSRFDWTKSLYRMKIQSYFYNSFSLIWRWGQQRNEIFSHTYEFPSSAHLDCRISCDHSSALTLSSWHYLGTSIWVMQWTLHNSLDLTWSTTLSFNILVLHVPINPLRQRVLTVSANQFEPTFFMHIDLICGTDSRR